MLRTILHIAMILVAGAAAFWVWLSFRHPQFVNRGFAWRQRPSQPERHSMPYEWVFNASRWIAGSGFVLVVWIVLDGLFGWIRNEDLNTWVLIVSVLVGSTTFLIVESVASDKDVNRYPAPPNPPGSTQGDSETPKLGADGN